jgi:hypothetical protein
VVEKEGDLKTEVGSCEVPCLTNQPINQSTNQPINQSPLCNSMFSVLPWLKKTEDQSKLINLINCSTNQLFNDFGKFPYLCTLITNSTRYFAQSF